MWIEKEREVGEGQLSHIPSMQSSLSLFWIKPTPSQPPLELWSVLLLWPHSIQRACSCSCLIMSKDSLSPTSGGASLLLVTLSEKVNAAVCQLNQKKKKKKHYSSCLNLKLLLFGIILLVCSTLHDVWSRARQSCEIRPSSASSLFTNAARRPHISSLYTKKVQTLPRRRWFGTAWPISCLIPQFHWLRESSLQAFVEELDCSVRFYTCIYFFSKREDTVF